MSAHPASYPSRVPASTPDPDRPTDPGLLDDARRATVGWTDSVVSSRTDARTTCTAIPVADPHAHAHAGTSRTPQPVTNACHARMQADLVPEFPAVRRTVPAVLPMPELNRTINPFTRDQPLRWSLFLESPNLHQVSHQARPHFAYFPAISSFFHRPHNPLVLGSNPRGPTLTSWRFPYDFLGLPFISGFALAVFFFTFGGTFGEESPPMAPRPAPSAGSFSTSLASSPPNRL